MFEYIYFARPDSVLDDKTAYEHRKNLGAELAKENGIDAAPWFVDALGKADPYIDFSTYDADSDGHLSKKELQVMFIVAGGESAAGIVPGIWAHASCLLTNETFDGYKIGECGYQGYSTFGERQWNHDATIRIIAHELGHAIFCFPDLRQNQGPQNL